MAIKLFFSFLLLFHQTSCQGETPIGEIYMGEWKSLFAGCEETDPVSLFISDKYIELGPNSFKTRYYYISQNCLSISEKVTIRLFDAKLSTDGGLNFNDLPLPSDTMVFDLFLKDEILVLLTYKLFDAAADFYIPTAFIRNDKVQEREFTPTASTVFVLPDEFRGSLWVAMEQPNGEPIQKDKEGRLLLEVPESGILETKAEVSPIAVALRELAFFYSEDWNNKQTGIPTIEFGCLMHLKIKNFSDDEIIKYGYDPDKVYVHYFRYNNFERKSTPKLFGKKIEGQVFWFQVNTLRNLLKPAPMVE